MACQPDDWVCTLLDKIGLEGFGRDTVEWVLARPLKIGLIVALALVGSRLGSRLAGRSIRSLAARSPLRDAGARSEKRAATLGGVAESAVRVVVWVLAGLLLLGELGLNLGPFLAGASIVGVAIGFGTQSLVRDFFSGFFILVEDQYGVGDSITIADVTGTVEEINLRVTRLRAADGTVWFVPNGEIRKVGNAAKEWSKAIVDVLVSNKADLEAAMVAIGEEAAAMGDDPAWADALLEPPEVLGVESMAAEGVTVRVSAKTAPAQRTPLARELRARITRRLQRDGVEAAEVARPTPDA